MGCCSLKAQRGEASWLSMALVCVPLELGGGLLRLVLVLPARVSVRAEEALASLDCLRSRNRYLINRKLGHLGWRCTVSGLILRRRPRLAGAVFKRLYPAVAGTAWLAALALVAGGALLAWGL